jgi:flagellar biosynthesis protein FlhB
MADTPEGERSEAATPRRREEALKEGRIPRSQELTIAGSLLASAAVLTAVGPTTGRAMMQLFTGALSGVGTLALDRQSAATLVRETGLRAAGAILPLILALAGCTLAISAAQARGVLSITPMMPDFARISPAANAKRMFGTQQLVDLIKALAKFGLVAAVVYPALRTALPSAIALAQESQLGFLMMARTYAVKLFASAGLAYLALASADYLWQWWRFQQSLKMTREEVKQEHKQQDGDPLMKQRRRSLGRARARRQMMRDVKKAHVVITNPTHIAIALRYDPKVAPAPVVLAIGQNLVAERIKELAREAGIPMVENRPLARALLKTARVGTLIPVELYVAVAEVLAFVFRTRGSRGSWTGSARV